MKLHGICIVLFCIEKDFRFVMRVQNIMHVNNQSCLCGILQLAFWLVHPGGWLNLSIYFCCGRAVEGRAGCGTAALGFGTPKK